MISAKGIIKLLAIAVCLQNFAFAGTTLYSKININKACEKDYERGMAIFKEGIKERLSSPKFYSEAIKAIEDGCRFAFSAGIFDAQGVFLQTTLIEYILERDWARRQHDFRFKDLAAQIRKTFKERLDAAFISVNVLDNSTKSLQEEQKIVYKIEKIFREEVKRKQAALPFGRFVFTLESSHPHTLYDIERDFRARPKTAKNGEIILSEGSYQKTSLRVFKMARKRTQQYLEWHPNVLIGSDSWLWSNKREEKEKWYVAELDYYTNKAKKLFLDLDPFFKLNNIFMNKKRAVLDRDIRALTRLKHSMLAAPLIPVGIAVGAWALGTVGYAIVPVGGGFFTIGGAPLTMAANISILSSLGAVALYTGIGTYHAIQDAKAHGFNITRALDTVLLASIQSIPLAALTPAVVGTTVMSGHIMWAQGKAFLAGTWQNMIRLRSMTGKEILREIPRVPGHVIKAWATKWWEKKGIILTNLGVSTITNIGFEYYDRLELPEDEQFFTKDPNGNINGLNKVASFNMTRRLITGVVAGPIEVTNNFWSRFLLWRALDITMSPLAQVVLGREVKKEKVAFDALYGVSFGTAIGEAERAIRYGPWMDNNQKTWKGKALNLVIAIGFKKIKNPIYIGMQSNYLKQDKKDFVAAVRDYMGTSLNIDLQDFNDDEVYEAFGNSMNMSDEAFENLTHELEEYIMGALELEAKAFNLDAAAEQNAS